MTSTIPFPPLDDGFGIDGFSIETLNGTKNIETWCKKNQARCYVVQVVYLETMETTMGRMGIGEEKSLIVFPSHIGTKRDVYTKSEELDTTRSNKLGVGNKETITITVVKNWL
jgi:hypothetical protein